MSWFLFQKLFGQGDFRIQGEIIWSIRHTSWFFFYKPFDQGDNDISVTSVHGWYKGTEAWSILLVEVEFFVASIEDLQNTFIVAQPNKEKTLRRTEQISDT